MCGSSGSAAPLGFTSCTASHAPWPRPSQRWVESVWGAGNVCFSSRTSLNPTRPTTDQTERIPTSPLPASSQTRATRPTLAPRAARGSWPARGSSSSTQVRQRVSRPSFGNFSTTFTKCPTWTSRHFILLTTHFLSRRNRKQEIYPQCWGYSRAQAPEAPTTPPDTPQPEQCEQQHSSDEQTASEAGRRGQDQLCDSEGGGQRGPGLRLSGRDQAEHLEQPGPVAVSGRRRWAGGKHDKLPLKLFISDPAHLRDEELRLPRPLGGPVYCPPVISVSAPGARADIHYTPLSVTERGEITLLLGRI